MVTVISTIQVMTEAASVAQINLIKAADKSGTVKRFVASEWTVLHTEMYALICILQYNFELTN